MLAGLSVGVVNMGPSEIRPAEKASFGGAEPGHYLHAEPSLELPPEIRYWAHQNQTQRIVCIIGSHRLIEKENRHCTHEGSDGGTVLTYVAPESADTELWHDHRACPPMQRGEKS